VWAAEYNKENDYKPVFKFFYPQNFGGCGAQFGWSDRGHLDIGSISNKTYLENSDYCGYIIQQFTGLKDANTKDIYEGDICRTYLLPTHRWVVKFGQYRSILGETSQYADGYGFYYESLDGKHQVPLCDLKVEWIGHIFMKPEDI
jgi:hypothetical protein